MAGLDCPEAFQNPELTLERFGRTNLQRNVFVVTRSLSESFETWKCNLIVESGAL
jgi:hypothetical protein